MSGLLLSQRRESSRSRTNNAPVRAPEASNDGSTSPSTIRLAQLRACDFQKNRRRKGERLSSSRLCERGCFCRYFTGSPSPFFANIKSLLCCCSLRRQRSPVSRTATSDRPTRTTSTLVPNLVPCAIRESLVHCFKSFHPSTKASDPRVLW